MSWILEAVRAHAENRAKQTAVRDGFGGMNYRALWLEVSRVAGQIPNGPIALYMDNGNAWAVADMACMMRRQVCVPLPQFFTPDQLKHALNDAGVSTLITDQARIFDDLGEIITRKSMTIAGREFSVLQLLQGTPAPIPADTAKITYTSGSTGTPKGVCLSTSAIDCVVRSLADASEAEEHDVSLALNPLAVLLENIASLYVPLLAGATACLPDLRTLGYRGFDDIDLERWYTALHHYQPSAMVMVPRQLAMLVAGVERGKIHGDKLRFIAAGGAPLPVSLLEQAARLGLPIYQGYGLSEAASVVTLNTPEHQRLGSVGRPLCHLRVSIADDGEILLHLRAVPEYLGERQSAARKVLATGDLGYLDKDGFLYFTGRKSSVFSTPHGRNVAPEWVENELCMEPAIRQAAVFGHALPQITAIIVPAASAKPFDIETAIQRVNQRLPVYARVERTLLADTAFSIANGQLTGTGRPRRREIEQHYSEQLRRPWRQAV